MLNKFLKWYSIYSISELRKPADKKMSDPNLEHRLREAVEIQSGQEPDLYFITQDGERVPAHR